MRRFPTRTVARLGLVAAPLTLLPGLALAESSSQLSPILDAILPQTEVFVDILDAANENIVFTGNQSATVYRPDGSLVGTFPAGSLINPDQVGAYRFSFATRSSWSLEVPGRTGGRVWSRDWRGESQGFGASYAFDFEAYAVVPGGDADRWGVVRLVGEGTNAAVFRVTASSQGLRSSPGLSVPDSGQPYDGQYRVYLEAPELFASNPLDALVTEVVSEVQSALAEDGVTELCDVVSPNQVETIISYVSSAEGTWRLVCDLDGDQTYEIVSGAEVIARGAAVIGTNAIAFDGRFADGTKITPGTYECAVHLAIGEMHFVVRDFETIYPGLRMYETSAPADNRALPLYWDDTAVQGNDVLMPNGQVSSVTSGEAGLLSGPFGGSGQPNVSARGWGRFTFTSKGNEAWMDTWTMVDQDLSETFSVTIVDGKLDTDGDSLRDVIEDCFYGTDPLLPDTDGDDVGDEIEVVGPSNPLKADTDDDCRPDSWELDPGGLTSPDTDGDGIRDVRDDDDDGDGISTCDEKRDGDDDDFDGDGKPNHQDLDADGDLWSDEQEGTGDLDGDGQPDFLDPDTVGIGQTFGDGFYAGGCTRTKGAPSRAAGGLLLLLALGLRRRRQA